MEKSIALAKEYLKRVCGNMEEPNTKDVVKYCTPIIAANMRIADPQKVASYEDADFENVEFAKIARNAFLMGYVCGQNDSY